MRPARCWAGRLLVESIGASRLTASRHASTRHAFAQRTRWLLVTVRLEQYPVFKVPRAGETALPDAVFEYETRERRESICYEREMGVSRKIFGNFS